MNGHAPKQVQMHAGHPKVLFLDQNKWIELAGEKPGSSEKTDSSGAFDYLASCVQQGKVIIPLTAANIYETQKRNDISSRKKLAYCQTVLSRGWVFKCSSLQRRIQLRGFFRKLTNVESGDLESQNPLSSFFLDAFAERYQIEDGGNAYSIVRKFSALSPLEAIFSYLTEIPEEARVLAVKNYSARSLSLIDEINKRKSRLKSEPLSLRRKAYKALLAYDLQSQVFSEAAAFGLTFDHFRENDGRLFRQTINELAGCIIETELVLKLDMKEKSVGENHLRDMQNILVSLPNCDVMVLENEFASLVEQCGFAKSYRAKLTTKLKEVLDLI